MAIVTSNTGKLILDGISGLSGWTAQDKEDAENYHELCEWLEIAYPEVFKHYKAVKDITNEPR